MSETLAGDVPAVVGGQIAVGASPWAVARRRLLRNRIALAMLAVFVLIVALCLAAPLYANYVAHTDPFQSNLQGTTIVDGRSVPIMQQESGSLLLPISIVGVVYVPYVARPIRGEVLSLRRRAFVEAAIGLGASTRRLLWSDILPNVVTTTIVFFPLMLALAMLTEAALSFLSIGVQPPDASWGTIILDGQSLLYTRPAVALAPGIAIAITVLALNVLGDGIRDALDPRAKLRGLR